MTKLDATAAAIADEGRQTTLTHHILRLVREGGLGPDADHPRSEPDEKAR